MQKGDEICDLLLILVAQKFGGYKINSLNEVIMDELGLWVYIFIVNKCCI